MIGDYISFPIFMISFGVGLVFVYLLGPEYKTILAYPTPENYTKMQYKDAFQQCFQYEPVATQCPFNPFSVKVMPVQ
jgi:hypothetical protein